MPAVRSMQPRWQAEVHGQGRRCGRSKARFAMHEAGCARHCWQLPGRLRAGPACPLSSYTPCLAANKIMHKAQHCVVDKAARAARPRARLLAHLRDLLCNLFARVLDLLLAGQKDQDVAGRLAHMDLDHRPNGRLQVVPLRLLPAQTHARLRAARSGAPGAESSAASQSMPRHAARGARLPRALP